MSSLLKIFFAVSGKRKYFCCRPKQFTVSDTSCSLFIFWINNFLFSNDLSTRKERKKPHTIRLTDALTSQPVKAGG